MCYTTPNLQYRTYLLILPFMFWLSACTQLRECCSGWNPLDYTVKRGDTLYSIAWRYEMDYREIAQWNNIEPPFRIFPGQRLRMTPDTMDGTIGADNRPSLILDEDLANQVERDSSAGAAIRPAAPAADSHLKIIPIRPDRQVTVQKGDTLYSLARDHQLMPSQLARWNGVRPPYEIFPGQQLRLTPPQHAYGTYINRQIEKNSAKPVVQQYSLPENTLPTTVSRWDWPVRGKIIKRFSKKDASRKGIAIAGKGGQPIKAAAPGKVVYSGNGLISYGNLVIIKHSNAFLSAYAHNKKLLVKEGDSVESGQVIAHMGGARKGRPQLHFEIRKNGKPVDPVQFLPKI